MPKGIILTPEQQMKRRREIIGIALRLIDENGFQKTSMREIAEMAGMGKSSLYDFFKTKDEIIVYALEEEIKVTIREADSIAQHELFSPEQRLRKIMHNQLSYARKNKTAIMWLYAEYAHLDESYQKRLNTVRFAYHRILQAVIEEGIALDVFRVTDVALTTRLLINSTLSIIYTTSAASSSLENMLEETIQIFLYGIKKEELQ